MSTVHTHTTGENRRAFTLIELLTVIAIIGILAAILIPTVGAVRASAHQASCAGNLRQIAVAVLVYASENRDTLPGPRNSGGSYLAMSRGIRNSENNTVNFASESSVASSVQLSSHIGAYLGTTRAGQMWRCVANSAGIEASTQGNSDSANEITYILNHRNAAAGTDRHLPFGGAGLRPAKLNEIRAAAASSNNGTNSGGTPWSSVTEHSRIWMISDADSGNYGTYSNYPAAGATGAVPMPHSGGRNYAFFDGHVEYRKANNLPANP